MKAGAMARRMSYSLSQTLSVIMTASATKPQNAHPTRSLETTTLIPYERVRVRNARPVTTESQPEDSQ